jgi:hypothetical protein
MPDIQEVTAGSTPLDRYGKWGGISHITKRVPANRLIGLCIGLPGCGKTTIFSSNPDAFIINCDCKGTPSAPQGGFWPHKDDELGRVCEYIDGKSVPINFDYEAILGKVEQLITAANNQDPDRPAIVVLDTLPSLLKLACKYTGKYAKSKFNIASSDDMEFIKLNGMAAWPRTYEHIIDNIILRLSAAGYGVFGTLHFSQQKLIIEGEVEENINVNIPDGFWTRLFPIFELVFSIEMELDVINVPKTRIIRGEEKVIPGSFDSIKTVKRVVYVDPREHPGRRGIIRPKDDMVGKFDLPQENGWAAFAEACAAGQQENSE